MKGKPTLWTKNFTCITLSTFLSIIGGEVITLPLSLLVFEQTQSTMLSAIILIRWMISLRVRFLFVCAAAFFLFRTQASLV